MKPFTKSFWGWYAFFMIAFVVVLLTVNCGGGGGPVGPGPGPSTISVSIRDGWTEAVLATQDTTAGARLDLNVAGYLPRATTASTSPTYLWPGELAYVQALVYSDLSPSHRLSRWSKGALTLGLGSYAGDTQVRAVAAQAIAAAQEATGVTLSLVDSGGDIQLAVNGSDPELVGGAVAFTRDTFVGNTIVGATMTFKARTYIVGGALRNHLLHELGHALGLGHSLNPLDVMCQGATRTNQETTHYSLDEQITLKLMYRWRQPGNSSPDADPGLGSTGTARTTRVIAD